MGNAAGGVGTVTGGTETFTGLDGLGSGGTEGNVVGKVPVIRPIGDFGS